MTLATLPPGHQLLEAAFSEAGRHVAWAAISEDGSAYAALDGKQGRPYAEVTKLVLLNGGKGHAFVARGGGSVRVVVDGREGPPFEDVGTLRPLPGGGAIYSASRGGRWRIVSGAREVPAEGDGDLLVSADGSRVAFLQQGGAPSRRRIRLCDSDLRKCVSGRDHDALSELILDRQGRHLAFVAESNRKQTVMRVDLAQPKLVEDEGPWFDAVERFAFSDRGGTLAFLARRGREVSLVCGGASSTLADVESIVGLAVTEGCRTLVAAIRGGRVVVLLDGAPIGEGFGGVEFPTLSVDGAHHAFGGERNPGQMLIVDGAQGPLFDRVVTPRFMPDGKHVAYRARKDGERFVVVAGLDARTTWESPRFEAVFDLTFPQDGSSIAYGVRRGQELQWKVDHP